MKKASATPWEDLDWFDIERRVFQLQRRIFQSAQENNRAEMHRIQARMVNLFAARCLAVHQASEVSKGRKTAGIDGIKSLSDGQKLALAKSLRIDKRPDPVLRRHIPKPGSDKTRPLGIPTMADRAHQHLIALALEPEWEARFTRSVFGFRKGRNAHDALFNIKRAIQASPKWVLDADIESFFDRLDHDAIIRKLDTFVAAEKAIGRILKATIRDGQSDTTPDRGTPQGGPLSPLIANIALCGLEADLEEAFPPNRVIDGERVGKRPRVILYADDLVVLHESKTVIIAVHSFLDQWLKPLGLNLSQTKTRVAHTLDLVDGRRGFDFLGHHIQQFRVGPRQVKRGIHTHISPGKEATKRIYAECAAIVDKLVPNPKRNAAYAHQRKQGRASHQEILIHHLNRTLRGWAGYFGRQNFKREFSRLDHLLFVKLWRWVRRLHPNWSRSRLVDVYFNGGKPWTFRVPNPPPEKTIALLRLDALPKHRHIPVRAHLSFYDGDWAYWGKRTGEYPGLPRLVGTCLKRQNGQCWHCRETIIRDDRILIAWIPDPKGSERSRLVHAACATNLPAASLRDPFSRRAVVRSPVLGDGHAGFRSTW